MTRKPVIGVVGGIGAGKSTAAAVLARRGGAAVNADALGHEALSLPAVKDQLVARWGPTVLKPDGTPNRRAIAGIVFDNPAELAALEGLVFPHIRRRVVEEIVKAQADPAVRFVVLDAAVMLEAGWSEVCDRIVYVDAPREVRLARLTARSGWSADEVTAREAAQLPLDEKRARADAVLVNDGSPEKLQEQVDRLLADWGLRDQRDPA
jgi:dephospho-CoA kinase